MTTSRGSWTVLIGMMVSTLLITGCGAGSGSTPDEAAPDASANASEGPASEAPLTEPSADPVAAVRSVEVQPGDLPPGYGPDVMEFGDEVNGRVTLDLCGVHFPSEDLRTVRHQVAYRLGDTEAPGYDATADLASVSSETVAYSPGGAEQAMGEVRAAIESCPRDFVPANVGGRPAARTTTTPILSAPDWQEDHVAVVARISLETGATFRVASVYQRRGDLLAMTYVMTSKNGRGAALAREMASLLSERLDAVPDPTSSSPTA